MESLNKLTYAALLLMTRRYRMNVPSVLCIFQADVIPVHYFAVFDGHAGTGAALMAANILHLIIQVCMEIKLFY